MRAQSAVFNLLTILVLAATALVVLACGFFFLVPAAVPGFLRQPGGPAQVALVTPLPTAHASPTSGYPTLPPQWTATPSPAPTDTVTPAPTETATDTPAPTGTPLPFTPAPSGTAPATQPSSDVVTAQSAANIRSGPGIAYPVISGLKAGDTAPVLGRDSSGAWFEVSSDVGLGGVGWVSASLVSYTGSIETLPVKLPLVPAPTATSPLPTATLGPPTQTPLPNVGGAGGIQTLQFYMHVTTGYVGDSLFFTFQVVNTSGSTINYGILAAHTDQGVTADSWHDPLKPGQNLTWTDHINFSTSGTYQVYLGICYASHDACKTGGAPWTRLSASTTVTIY